jgi:DNA polymerase III delta prime subunit
MSIIVNRIQHNSEAITKQIPWVEKYRPTHFDDIVLDPINRKLFKNILDKNYFPNLLFYGPPGTGKTTTIINLINEFQSKYYKINKNLVIHLNASDERGIDIIRNQIHQFVKTNNMFDTGLKFVILDEVDYMTKNAQQALKYLLQTCSQNVRFCLICNYISKIEESLQNEFICIRFNQLPKPDIYQFIQNISDNEKLNLTEELIQTIQITYQSDIRSMINFIQLNQNFVKADWENKILNKSILENIHQMISSKKIANETDDMIYYLYDISVQYNMDKRTIILSYFHFILEEYPDIVTTKFLNIISNLIHNTDVKTEHMVKYFLYQLNDYYSIHRCR